jgi:hypothetical protein
LLLSRRLKAANWELKLRGGSQFIFQSPSAPTSAKIWVVVDIDTANKFIFTPANLIYLQHHNSRQKLS